MLYKKDVLVG